jgi:hypothetical protein
MTGEERHGYIRGVLAACIRLNAPEQMATDLCSEVEATPEELLQVAHEEVRNAKGRTKSASGGVQLR